MRDREAYMESYAALGGSILSPWFIKIVVAVVLVLIIATAVVRCSTTSDASTGQLFEDIYASIHSRADVYKLSEADIVERLEAQGVESAWAEQAASMAQSDSRFMLMALYSDELGREGSEVTNKIVKLAVNDPEAVDYVVGFIEKYPQETAEPYTETVRKGKVPRLYQWDERWAYVTYSSTTFGCTGCGPTSLSMVYMAVTGKNDKSPADMAQLATQDGFETEYEGTTNQFFTTEAASLGLNVSELDVSSDALSEALEQGTPVICNVGPGDFTLQGHFFVITSLNEDGTVNINDPFSSVNSARSWDMDQILDQTIAFYAYDA